MYRCTNPGNPAWPRYGGRGIAFEFDSVAEAARWVMEHMPPEDRELELDRVDNNRGYAPGNLRWTTHQENCANRECTKLAVFRQEEWPYSENTVRRKLCEGLSREEIIEQARLAVAERRKCWRTIEGRLRSMTS